LIHAYCLNKVESAGHTAPGTRVEMKVPKIGVPISMPVWQSVLVAHGCQLDNGSEILPLRLKPVGESLHCTPTMSGSLLPFNVPVRIGQTVTITWNSELSRYIVEWPGETIAA
jgi:hypothetical protein